MPICRTLCSDVIKKFFNGTRSTLRNTLRHSLFVTLLAAGLAGCGNNFGFPGVYRIDVEQGNIVTPEMVEQLKPGMTRRQVRFVMGTPLIEDTFHEDRWDYRYTLRNGNDTLEQNRLTVFFEGDALVNVTGTDVPEWAAPQGSDTSENEGDADAE